MHVDPFRGSCVRRVHAAFNCVLQPSALQDPREAALQFLETRMHTHMQPHVDGLLLCIDSPSLHVHPVAPILDEQPGIHPIYSLVFLVSLGGQADVVSGHC